MAGKKTTFLINTAGKVGEFYIWKVATLHVLLPVHSLQARMNLPSPSDEDRVFVMFSSLFILMRLTISIFVTCALFFTQTFCLLSPTVLCLCYVLKYRDNFPTCSERCFPVVIRRSPDPLLT